MPWNRPTLTALRERCISDLRTYTVGREDETNTIARRAVLRVLGFIIAGVTHLCLGFIEWAIAQMFTSTTTEMDYLYLQGDDVGVPYKSGSFASGTFLVTGTVGKVIPAGRFVVNSVTGLKYIVQTNYTIPVSGNISVSLRAERVGNSYNETSGVTLRFVSPIPGVSTTGIIDTEISNGTNAETKEQYRNRILNRKRQPPKGGASFDYIAWCLEYPGVTRSWAIKEYYGVGTVGIAFVFDNRENIFPSSAERDLVKEYLIYHLDPGTGVEVGAPVGGEQGIIMIVLAPLSKNFDIDIYPNTPTTRENVTTSINNLISEIGPGDKLTIPSVQKSVANTLGIELFRINYPTEDEGISTNRLPSVGVINFGDY